MVGMHIHIIPNRNSTPAVLLRESYRVGGNVRKRTKCRRPEAGPDEPTFDVTTTPDSKQQRAYDLLKGITV